MKAGKRKRCQPRKKGNGWQSCSHCKRFSRAVAGQPSLCGEEGRGTTHHVSNTFSPRNGTKIRGKEIERCSSTPKGSKPPQESKSRIVAQRGFGQSSRLAHEQVKEPMPERRVRNGGHMGTAAGHSPCKQSADDQNHDIQGVDAKKTPRKIVFGAKWFVTLDD